MLSNQIVQTSIDGLKTIVRRDIDVLDRDGKRIASTKTHDDTGSVQFIESILLSPAEHQSIEGSQYFKIADNLASEYVLVVHGDDEDAFRMGKLAAFHLKTLMIAYREKFDRDNFIKNLLMDNMLLVDIYSRAKKLRIEMNARRVVFLVHMSTDADFSASEILRVIFPDRQRNFVTAVDENHVILVKELADFENMETIMHTARTIVDTLTTEVMSRVCVAIGSIVDDLKSVSASFKEAQLAREVGRIFEAEKQIVSYEKLGIGRLIYQLPMPLCRIFINEMLQGFSIDDIDEEMFITVTKFFENDLNVSETARDLFIHRNTLVYRLNRLQKMTDLDLRKFNDAITFKITLMVNSYMQHREKTP